MKLIDELYNNKSSLDLGKGEVQTFWLTGTTEENTIRPNSICNSLQDLPQIYQGASNFDGASTIGEVEFYSCILYWQDIL